MSLDALQAWLAMGGDARYVWPAWALALAVLAGCALHARRERRRVLDALRRPARRGGMEDKRDAHDPA
ncbi:heme exporter protein CcmD [Modicisalibacter radicis]|uniref:heme exporter protein CcmD n=1 Tax=Halomonas sp. EAR18 TaxID=2518972 RepID=UPI00109D4016|nr:heme exporter protein CcmD [Halomonas sp. EAR18]